MPNEMIQSREDALEITMERIAKLDIPLLVIGLGGTGCGVLREIKATFRKRYQLAKGPDGKDLDRPDGTAYIAIDTDSTEKAGFNEGEFLLLNVDGVDQLLAEKTGLQPYETAWLDPKMIASRNGSGAGTVRQSSRFQLARCYTNVSNTIANALSGISSKIQGAGVSGELQVMIIAGLCGGTGSGTFLDIPQIVRQAAAQMNKGCQITGFFVMPDATLSANGASGSDAVKFQANGYAALKELDFWQNYATHQTPYSIQYNASLTSKVEWKCAPYDHAVLLSGTNVGGTPIAHPMETLQKTVAENLLNYLANEVVEVDGEGRPEFSYMKHENNLKQLILVNAKSTFVNHCYRAIGAYTMAIPQDKMLAYQSNLLLKAFLPEISEITHQPIPKIPRLTLHQLPDDLKKAMPSAQERGKKMCVELLPAFCSYSSKDKDKMETLREWNPAPHLRKDQNNWDQAKVYGAANTTARAWLEEAWSKLVAYFKEIIKNKEEGPHSLLSYLQDGTEWGMMSYLNKLEANINNAYKKARTDTVQSFNSCKDTYGSFVKPPLMSAAKCAEIYMGNLSEYYTNIIKERYWENMCKAIAGLLIRVKRFTAISLTALCNDMDTLGSEFSNEDLWKAGVTDLIEIDKLQDRINTIYAEVNKEDAIVCSYLARLADQVTDTTECSDPDKAYVDFTYGSKGQFEKYATLRDELRKSFDLLFKVDPNANESLLDKVFQQASNENMDILDKIVGDKLTKLQNGATPLFMNTPRYGETPVIFSYLSIPQNAKCFNDYIKRHQAQQKITPKKSAITDRVYCLLTWDSIGLYNYTALGQIAKSYESLVVNDAMCGGLHLVWNRNDVNPSIQNNWRMLPEPAPYYYESSINGSPREKESFEATNALVTRAVKCGMISVKASEVPEYTIRFFMTNGTDGILVSNDKMKADITAVREMDINKRTGDAYTVEDKINALQDLMKNAVTVRRQLPTKPFQMHYFCGIGDHELMDPFDVNKVPDDASKAIAEENYMKLCLAACAALLEMDPYLKERVSKQIDAFELWSKELNALSGGAKIWDARVSYAGMAAKMQIYNIIIPGAVYRFKKGKEKIDIINEALLADDLKDEDNELIKTVAYLADRGEADSVRKELEKAANAAEAAFLKAEKDEELEEDEVDDMITDVKDLQSTLEELADEKNSAKLNGGDAFVLGKQLELIEGMQKVVNKMAKTLRQIKKNL